MGVTMADKATILVGEDDPDSAGVIREMLEIFGFQVERASGLDELIDAINERRGDMVLLDLSLCGHTDCELLEHLIAVPKRPPIVIFSARTLGDIEAAAERLGAAAVLQKPAGMNKLVTTVKQVLATSRALS